MPGFEDITGQQRSIQMLTTLLKKGGIPHALLFTGIEGVGKRTAATAFAMACNCTSATSENACYPTNPCGSCRACRKISSGIHPDIIELKPSGNFIRIDQIRTLCRTLTMKPYEANVRVVIISDAQTMNPQAANALLKALEEPPERTIFILTAIQISDLLPTIVSRCQHIRFDPIPRETLESLLMERTRLDRKDAAIIASMAGGSYSRALSRAEKRWNSRRMWLIDEIEALPSRPVNLLMAFAVKLAEDKESLSDSLEIVNSWLRDLIVCRYRPGKIVNIDMGQRIAAGSRRIDEASLLSGIEAIETARKDIRANANMRLTLDLLIMSLARCCRENGKTAG
ncbi:MAG: DNA polymerase III subunit delta' [Desulfobacterales bacterium]|nr:DNA polymerase III subunit delta' [Desulfobacterales bacterium]MDD4071051.1 DNA polymerase III subunit delta' [Desulfobacterales bacterium]MDD4392448.1 DNA polymerase III subunit delta' [Desulfobacterales bacterium]